MCNITIISNCTSEKYDKYINVHKKNIETKYENTHKKKTNYVKVFSCKKANTFEINA